MEKTNSSEINEKFKRLLLWMFRNIHGQTNFSDNIIEEANEIFKKYSINKINEMIALWIIVGIKNFEPFNLDLLLKRNNLTKEEINQVLDNNGLCKELLPIIINKNDFEQKITALRYNNLIDKKLIQEAIERAYDWVSKKGFL